MIVNVGLAYDLRRRANERADFASLFIYSIVNFFSATCTFRPKTKLLAMSPNNVILVAHMADKSYVFENVNADTEWSEEWARAQVATGDRLFKRRRGDALVLAHDMQNRIKTEYGVREVFLEQRTKRPRPSRKTDGDGESTSTPE
jgi:hypothetical protein